VTREYAKRGTIVPEVSQYVDKATYSRLYRARRPKKDLRDRTKVCARAAAALYVAKQHPEEFARAIRREERKRGLL
jgi:hypothetical protein